MFIQKSKWFILLWQNVQRTQIFFTIFFFVVFVLFTVLSPHVCHACVYANERIMEVETYYRINFLHEWTVYYLPLKCVLFFFFLESGNAIESKFHWLQSSSSFFNYFLSFLFFFSKRTMITCMWARSA